MSDLILPASAGMTAPKGHTLLEKGLLRQVQQLEQNQAVGLKYLNYLQALLFECLAILEEEKAEVVLSEPLLEFYTKQQEQVRKAKNARKTMLEDLSNRGTTTGSGVEPTTKESTEPAKMVDDQPTVDQSNR